MSRTTGVYKKLGRRLNRFPQGASATRLLYAILRILFSPEEAELAGLMPVLPFSAARAAKIWKIPELEARKKLERMASKGLLVDILRDSGTRLFVLPPPMAGFFELSLMRIRSDLDQKALSRLFHDYINVQEDFIQDLFLGGKTSFGRVFVHEPALPPAHTEILDYEKASHVIRSASAIAVGICYCRQKMEHMGRACSAPKAICMTFNHAAAPLIRNGFARRIDAVECMDLLQQAYACNLVQGGENVQRHVTFICNCCSCCCEGLIATRRLGARMPIQTTNYIPRFDSADCNGCGTCARVCPAEAIQMLEAMQGADRRHTALNETICLGCGICVRNCPRNAIRLEPRACRVITPFDMSRRIVEMAVERGLLQNLIFDNQALLSHRLLAAVLGAVLKLPPLKQALANKQLKSYFLEALTAWKGSLFHLPESGDP